jgi:acetyl-CoA/propionyl-CoA carboxylase biotin carboxyl carrier protein
LRGHSIEFRINAEDAGRNFLPAPGTITAMRVPSGPGVRVDGGYETGATVPSTFDSLIAKLIVTGRDRQQSLERSRRALAEYEIEGMPTVLPFHRAVVDDPAFATDDATPFTVHTRWIETEFQNAIPPWSGLGTPEDPEPPRERVTVEVDGKRLEVVLPAGLSAAGGLPASKPAPKRAGRRKTSAAASGDTLTSPMQGTIVKLAVDEGQEVAAGELVVVLEAMKMEQPLNAHKSGTITGLKAEVGQTLASGATICDILD